MSLVNLGIGLVRQGRRVLLADMDGQGSLTASLGYSQPDQMEVHIWKYQGNNGAYAKDDWIYVCNPYSQEGEKHSWFHFDKNGVMTYGWYKADERIWYYCHEVSDGSLGKLVKGWHEDS